MMRSMAEEYGLRATFMPKPFAHLTGSGSHAHISLWDAATGACVSGGGAPANFGLSPTSLDFLSGLLRNAPALLALTNPTINSYKRLNATGTSSGATWSPTAATWAGNNRSALVRVPGGATRMELRVADMAANPYLMAAGIGAAGLDGLARKVPPPPPCDRNMYDPSDPLVAAAIRDAPPLPRSLAGALDLLDASPALRSGLGDAFVDSYLKLRRTHVREYEGQLTPWELREYLDA
jgi:glutamine synthetase